MRPAVAAAVAAIAIPACHAAGDDSIRIGIIGCGSRGRGAAVQAAESSKNVRITALADLFPDAIDQTLEYWKDRPRDAYQLSRDRCFTGWDAYKDLLKTDVNYVILTTPSGFRPLHLAAAIDAGKHVYAEKAIAVDPAGVRTVLGAVEKAKQNNLGIVCGTWRRHDRGYIETIQRIRDGAIGKIIRGRIECLQGGIRLVPRKPGWSDMEWQVRNFTYFTWLGGDLIVDQHIHQIDVMHWVLGRPPKFCMGMGGRQARVGEAFGNAWDHFAVEYEFGDAHVVSLSRQIEGADMRIGERFWGTEGWADVGNLRIAAAGKDLWRFRGDRGNPYLRMHSDLIDSVRQGKAINYGTELAHSHMMAIMGRMASYSGQTMLPWSDALASPLSLMPAKLALGPLPVDPVPIPGRQNATRPADDRG